jgi:hypothetical protein
MPGKIGGMSHREAAHGAASAESSVYGMTVNHGLRAFLSNILDYAGLFPPASLPLDQAIRNYAAYRGEAEAWMLARFVCPSAWLGDLGAYAHLFDRTSPLTLSALSRASVSEDDFLSGVRQSLSHVAAFRREHGARVSVDVIELPLPHCPISPTWLTRMAETIEAGGPPRLTPFVEPKLIGDWRHAITAAVDAAAAHNARWRGERCQPVGLKLRTGGIAADAFPTPEQVAFVIVVCRDRGVALKCTAGLHHPVRGYDQTVRTTAHGFLNVFAAGILACAQASSESHVRAVLEDEQPAHFVFDDDGFTWSDARASIEAITTARRAALISFGSCSFDEPRSDLQKLGWMPAAT